MVDEAHGAGVLGARGAGACELLGVEDRVDLRMGTFSKSLASCGGFVAGPAEVIEYLRIQSRAFLFTAVRRARGGRRGAGGAAGRALGRRAARCCAACSTTRATCSDGLRERGFRVVEPTTLPDGSEIVTPIVPVLVGDDWKAVLLWRALYDAGVFVNTALHPAVPARRRAAAHERDGDARRRATLDRALEAFAAVKGRFEAEHGALPGPEAARRRHHGAGQKTCALSGGCRHGDVDLRAGAGVGSSAASATATGTSGRAPKVWRGSRRVRTGQRTLRRPPGPSSPRGHMHTRPVPPVGRAAGRTR